VSFSRKTAGREFKLRLGVGVCAIEIEFLQGRYYYKLELSTLYPLVTYWSLLIQSPLILVIDGRWLLIWHITNKFTMWAPSHCGMILGKCLTGTSSVESISMGAPHLNGKTVYVKYQVSAHQTWTLRRNIPHYCRSSWLPVWRGDFLRVGWLYSLVTKGTIWTWTVELYIMM
jgi:hypothetical protein